MRRLDSGGPGASSAVGAGWITRMMVMASPAPARACCGAIGYRGLGGMPSTGWAPACRPLVGPRPPVATPRPD